MPDPTSSSENQSNSEPVPNSPGHYVPYDRTGEEIRLIDYWRILVSHRFLIIATTFLATILSVIVALTTTPVYRASVLMAPIRSEDGPSGLSNLAGQLGGVASLAGINFSAEGDEGTVALATLESRVFTELFIEEQNLLTILFPEKWNDETQEWDVGQPEQIPSMRDAVRKFERKIRTVTVDNQTGLITLEIDWNDKELASRWANLLVERVNSMLRQRMIIDSEKSMEFLNNELEQTGAVELKQAIYRLIEIHLNKKMLANVRAEYAFEIIDPAGVLDERDRVKPRKSLIVVLGFMLGAFLGVFLALISHIFQAAGRGSSG